MKRIINIFLITRLEVLLTFVIMSSDIHHAIGRIVSMRHRVSKNNEGYTLLVIRCNIPYKTTYLKFCVWNDNKLNYNGSRANEGDDVSVNYTYEGTFPILSSIQFIDGGLGECFRCFAFREQNYSAQLMECPDCLSISSNQQRERINLTLTLVQKTVKPFKYSRGLCLKFVDRVTDRYYNATIFEKNPLFPSVSGIEILKNYRVFGWEENISKFSDIDIVDVYDEI